MTTLNPHIATQIAEHIASGKDIADLTNTLSQEDFGQELAEKWIGARFFLMRKCIRSL